MTTADSAGRPWEGRSFSAHDDAYRNDDGAMPAAFGDAMRSLRERGHDVAPVVESLRDARLLVPLVAEAGGLESVAGRTVEKSQELSIVTVVAPDGAPILPMFSNVEALQAWRSDARPVPASTQRAAAAALEDGTGRIIVDPGSWSEIVLTGSMLTALLTGDPWQPPQRHPVVVAELVAPLLSLPGLSAVLVSTSDPQSRLAGRSVELRVLFRPDVDRTVSQAAFEERAREIGGRRDAWIRDAPDVVFEVVWLRGRARLSPTPGTEVYTP